MKKLLFFLRFGEKYGHVCMKMQMFSKKLPIYVVIGVSCKKNKK